MITSGWMLIVGCAIVGWMLPEFVAVQTWARVPIGMNIICAIAGALIAGAFVV